MYTHNPSWIEAMKEANMEFKNRVDPSRLPSKRTPGSKAVITCMDPRVNLEAVGIQQFLHNGEGSSSIRIIRTIGGMVEERSLIIGCFLAGINEIAVLMHTDCGCSLAFDKIDIIIENMTKTIERKQLDQYREVIGEPFQEKLMKRLKVFQDPYQAVRDEVSHIKSLPYAPQHLVVHGLVYDLESGRLNVEVNGDL